MKIAITSQGGGLDAEIDPRFGRASGFIVYDTGTGVFEHVGNEQNLNAMQGAGIQSAKKIADSGAKALITGHCGPKAFEALRAAGVSIYTGAHGTVSDAIEKFKRGELAEAGAANVEGHWT